jgi:hypothetical protein
MEIATTPRAKGYATATAIGISRLAVRESDFKENERGHLSLHGYAHPDYVDPNSIFSRL